MPNCVEELEAIYIQQIKTGVLTHNDCHDDSTSVVLIIIIIIIIIYARLNIEQIDFHLSVITSITQMQGMSHYINYLHTEK